MAPREFLKSRNKMMNLFAVGIAKACRKIRNDIVSLLFVFARPNSTRYKELTHPERSNHHIRHLFYRHLARQTTRRRPRSRRNYRNGLRNLKEPPWPVSKLFPLARPISLNHKSKKRLARNEAWISENGRKPRGGGMRLECNIPKRYEQSLYNTPKEVF